LSDEDAEKRARDRIGTVLNEKWTLEALLGSGGMGAVYGARHRNGARAAVKVLHPELARYPEVRERFLREGYAANKVEHDGAVKVLDDDVIVGGADDGGAYLVMELLEGESLEDRLARGAMPTERELLVIVDAVLEVLEAAHARGVVHRDIKPENLFLLPSGEVKLLDFGLARLNESQSTTTHGVALGTPSFMSPEQAAGRADEIDGRTDLFSLAASCFRLVAGRPVHEGLGPVDRVMKMANVPAPKLRDVAPKASPELARIVDHALEFRRDDRYASATVMRADVKAAIAALDAAAEQKREEERTRALPIIQDARPPPKPKRSFVPMLTAIVIGAIGGKILYDVVTSKGAAAPALRQDDVGSASATAATSGLAPAASVPAPASAAASAAVSASDAAAAPDAASDADALGDLDASALAAAGDGGDDDGGTDDDGGDDTDAGPDDNGDAAVEAGAPDAAPRPVVKPRPRPRPRPRPPHRRH
jgi:serine/threonine-protein kinase